MTLFIQNESSHLRTDMNMTFTGRKLVNPLMVYKWYFFCHGLYFHMLSWKAYSSYLHVGPCHCWLHPVWTANRRLILNHKVNSFLHLLWGVLHQRHNAQGIHSPTWKSSSSTINSCAALMLIYGVTHITTVSQFARTPGFI